MAGLQGWQLVIIILLAILLFAAPKLPAMARNLGQSMRIFSSEVKQMRTEDKDAKDGKDTRSGSGSTAADEPVEGRVVERDETDVRPRDER